MDSAQGGVLTPFFGNWSQSENLTEINTPADFSPLILAVLVGVKEKLLRDITFAPKVKNMLRPINL